MRFIYLVSAVLLVASSAFAGYDSSWYQADYWSGEYPTGFAVVQAHASVKGRKTMDPMAKADVTCTLPYKAVFQEWNEARNKKNQVVYHTASKIKTLTAKEDFTYTGDDTPLTLKKGDQIEFLIYQSEGWFTIRFAGKEYSADQSLLDHLEPFDQDGLVQEDQWMRLRCTNGKTAWLFYPDLVSVDAQGNVKYAPGLGDWGAGMDGYGSVHDLP